MLSIMTLFCLFVSITHSACTYSAAFCFKQRYAKEQSLILLPYSHPTRPQGSPLFTASYLSDLSLSMARNPSFGVILGLTYNLAPSTPGRFGGHLCDLLPWKETILMLFLRLKSYLWEIRRKRIEEKSDRKAQVRRDRTPNFSFFSPFFILSFFFFFF